LSGRRNGLLDARSGRVKPVGPYKHPGAVGDAYDPRGPEAAREIIRRIAAKDPSRMAERVGGSAVPQCDGKGVPNLLIAHAPGGLECAKSVLADRGYQRQTGRDPFPEDRPMRVGSIRYKSKVFPIHAHAVARDSAGAAERIRFRKRMRGNPRLRRAYVPRNREILRAGIADSIDYSVVKGACIGEVLEEKRDSLS
jgi:GrpB-like predicted nucleotidyltransferase (UPF0157 family)